MQDKELCSLQVFSKVKQEIIENMELDMVGREMHSYPSVKPIMLDRAKSAL